jgi:hypothetical protein
MGRHDRYGKDVLLLATDSRAAVSGHTTRYSIGGHGSAQIDGTYEDIAVEIESRTDKQIGGAVLDLYLHPFPKKLLILIPAHQANPTTTKAQALYLLDTLGAAVFEVVLFEGSGHEPRTESRRSNGQVCSCFTQFDGSQSQ